MQYDQIIRLWIGPKLLIFLMDPRDVEIILSSQVYIDKSSEYRFFKPWLGNGLLISTGTYIQLTKDTLCDIFTFSRIIFCKFVIVHKHISIRY